MHTDATRSFPPFYTQVIGSLPRPKLVLELLSRRDAMDPAEYRARMDEMVTFAIRLQELAGLDVVSDGEWRRSQYTDELLERLGGFTRSRPFEHAGEGTKMHLVATGRIEATDPVFLEDAQFLRRHTDRATKFALPSPFLVGIRYWHEDYSTGAYPTVQHLMDELSEVLAREARALVDAGIDIVQLDDPAMTYFCDRALMSSGDTHDDRLRQQWDIDRQMPQAVDMINRILGDLPAMTHLHCCHSVYKRQSDVTGNYEPILPRLTEAKIDQVNLEFAYQGTGDATDLDLLPAHLNVGMGVVDVRGERIQSIGEIEAIAAAGAERIDASRIALNPDCGFAPGSGEPPTIDEAFEKLCNLVAAAKRMRARVQGPGSGA
ncbi:MAG: hypothetical protein CMJ18_14820 [Phycisphaeraceae bacterium]|nr:hypothetical protein [Phycisphaeraceae bacterium]